jgi:hypothetical protein
MVDRRKDKRDSSKKIDIKRNKISKIILYKKVIPSLLSFVIGVFYTLYILTNNYFLITKEKERLEQIKTNIKNIKNKKYILLKQNEDILKKLSASDNYMINTDKVKTLLTKFLELLRLKNIITSSHIINIKNDNIYQNVVEASIQVDYNSRFLNIDILRDLIKILLKDILYLKDISTEENIIKIQIYKKV